MDLVLSIFKQNVSFKEPGSSRAMERICEPHLMHFTCVSCKRSVIEHKILLVFNTLFVAVVLIIISSVNGT